ncbi:hypothetical protein HID58_018480 [Brassica napus]|uniref:Uncharacterized protein n=1 Tax=Brassica napus TaxID=3708 RepID=A0ABQ8D9Z6_BRANA|nr:hypothetical protein HID58_018480 [Brassica napus]
MGTNTKFTTMGYTTKFSTMGHTSRVGAFIKLSARRAIEDESNKCSLWIFSWKRRRKCEEYSTRKCSCRNFTK